METAERFSDRVANYIRFRPGYPPEMLGLFREKMGLSPSTVIADIGCGPGMSSELFVSAGCTVFGVEPNESMRAAAIKAFAESANFKAVDGTAQATNLGDSSVDIVIAAQAFHWFNEEPAVREFRRIVRPGGFAAMIWNERQLDSTPFLRGYEELLLRFGTDYKEVRHDNLSRKDLSKAFGSPFEAATFPNHQELDLEGISGRLRSSSYTPPEGHTDFEPMIARLKELFARYQENGKIQLLYDTNVFYTRLQ